MIRKHVLRSAGRWPDCGAWEMDGFYHALRGTILELEDAWPRGGLRALLTDRGIARVIGPDLHAAYVELTTRGREPAPERRRAAIHALLRQLRDEVFSIEHWGTVRGTVARSGGDGPLDTALDGGPEVRQRLDQVAARRFWGLGFVHADDLDATDLLARKCVREGVKRLARDLRDLTQVLQKPLDGAPVRVPSHADRGFEQLMLDILDEHHRRANPAPLVEDFCQKTDLRVRYPGLDRRRGARVQIKSTANPQLHEERVATIRRRETLVILSPVTLAEFIDEQQRARAPERLLTKLELLAFWHALPCEPIAIDELAYAIRDVLFGALRHADRDPRGPMAAVPDALRLVIRAFVRDRAFRSTKALRVWERSNPVYGGLRGVATRRSGGQTV